MLLTHPFINARTPIEERQRQRKKGIKSQSNRGMEEETVEWKSLIGFYYYQREIRKLRENKIVIETVELSLEPTTNAIAGSL